MVRHSKNNTASSAFTKAEYGKLRDVWGSKNVRVGAESMRHYDQCSLCLNTAESPVMCTQGHLFCKECLISALLEQKREIASLQLLLERLEQEQEQERLRARHEAIATIQGQFDRTQSGAGAARFAPEKGQIRSRRSPSPVDRAAADRGRQRQRSRSPERVSGSRSLADLPARIAAQTERAIAEAMRHLSEEHALAKRRKIPAYWLPSLTPSSRISKEEAIRQTEETMAKSASTKCFVGDVAGHSVSLKSLIEVNFVLDNTMSNLEKQQKLCPSCKKTLNDVSKLFVLRKCGHVHCATCVETLIAPLFKKKDGADESSRRAACLECSAKVKSLDKDVIGLQREGTGFSLAGNNEARKKGVAFQG